MAQVVKLKRSSTAGNVPTSGQMVAGELAMNTADGKLFLRDGSDVRPIVTVDNEVTGSINLSGNISAIGDISSSGTFWTTKTGSEDDPALLIGQLSGWTIGNKAGFFIEEFAPGLNVPWFTSDGTKKLGFGTVITAGVDFNMATQRIYFDSDQTNTYIASDTDDPENLEIHADANIELRADNIVEIYSSVSASGDITGSDVYIDEWGSVSASLAAAGNVNNTGTPGNNQVAVWIDDTTIEGNSNLTWDGFTLEVDGSTGIRASSISNRHNDGRLGINAAGEWGYGADIWHHGAISSVTAGKVYYLNSSDGWTVAASGSLTAATGFLGVAPSTGNTSGGLVIRGFVYMNNNPGGSTGDKVYLADNGLITTTLPSTSTHFVRILGYKTAQTGVIYFNPSNEYIQLA